MKIYGLSIFWSVTANSNTVVDGKINKSYKVEQEVNGINYKSESTYTGIVICQIVDIYTSEDDQNYVEVMTLDNIPTRFEMVDQKNADSVNDYLT